MLIKDDLRDFLSKRYQHARITEGEIETVIRQLETLPASDLYNSNKTFCSLLRDGFLLKREASAKAGSASQKDLYIQLVDFDNVAQEVKQSLLAKASVEQLQPELAKVAEKRQVLQCVLMTIISTAWLILYYGVQKEMNSGDELGISIE